MAWTCTGEIDVRSLVPPTHPRIPAERRGPERQEDAVGAYGSRLLSGIRSGGSAVNGQKTHPCSTCATSRLDDFPQLTPSLPGLTRQSSRTLRLRPVLDTRVKPAQDEARAGGDSMQAACAPKTGAVSSDSFSWEEGGILARTCIGEIDVRSLAPPHPPIPASPHPASPHPRIPASPPKGGVQGGRRMRSGPMGPDFRRAFGVGDSAVTGQQSHLRSTCGTSRLETFPQLTPSLPGLTRPSSRTLRPRSVLDTRVKPAQDEARAGGDGVQAALGAEDRFAPRSTVVPTGMDRARTVVRTCAGEICRRLAGTTTHPSPHPRRKAGSRAAGECGRGFLIPTFVGNSEKVVLR